MSHDTASEMTGAQALISTFADHGVDACFANPGTSEMHLVTALDNEPRIRSVLGLVENVATGAADGYARVTGKPATTLLHLGPGYLNGGANLHNARRARSPIVNIIGDHATYHRKHDAPLTSDIEGMSGPNSVWVGVAHTPEEAGSMASEAWQASLKAPCGPASLIVPADVAWLPGGSRVEGREAPARTAFSGQAVEAAAKAIRNAKQPAIITTGTSLGEAGLQACARLKAAGVRVLYEFMFPHIQRGAGRFAPDRMQYLAEMAADDLQGIDLMVAVESRAPVAFFAYPGKPSELKPEGCEVISIGGYEIDGGQALAALAEALGATESADPVALASPGMPTGELDGMKVGASLARHLPENAFVSDDAATNSVGTWLGTIGARPHDWMPLSGGSLGQGMPVALGAAVAAPDRKGVCLLGDGAAMYTPQTLWSMAREGANVVNVVFVNNAYRVLHFELARTGAGAPGPTAEALLGLGNPAIDWVGYSQSLGVPAVSVDTAEGFDQALERALAAEGPQLIAAVVP